jgi:hypothetical protein
MTEGRKTENFLPSLFLPPYWHFERAKPLRLIQTVNSSRRRQSFNEALLVTFLCYLDANERA